MPRAARLSDLVNKHVLPTRHTLPRRGGCMCGNGDLHNCYVTDMHPTRMASSSALVAPGARWVIATLKTDGLPNYTRAPKHSELNESRLLPAQGMPGAPRHGRVAQHAHGATCTPGKRSCT